MFEEDELAPSVGTGRQVRGKAGLASEVLGVESGERGFVVWGVRRSRLWRSGGK